MTSVAIPPISRPRAESRWLWAILALLLTPFIAIAVLAAGISSYFRLSSDTNALRDGVIRSSGVEWRKQIALNVGGLTFGAARAGFSFVRLPEEARVALAAVRGVEFGVYRVPTGVKSPDRATMLNAAERSMTARGWERLVRVMEGGDLVTIYVPKSTGSGQVLKCCVLVFDGDQMVIVSGKADLESLIQCGLEKLPGVLKVSGQRFPSQAAAKSAPLVPDCATLPPMTGN